MNSLMNTLIHKKPTVKALFKKYRLCKLTISNRFVMASIPRCRADPKTGIPTELHVLYYSQRASAGLIITEPSHIANNAQSILGNPGIHTPDQVKGWKRVAHAVHAEGSKIFIQLCHAGRAAHPDLVGEPNIAPSAIAIKGDLTSGFPHQMPREMTQEDIKTVLSQFRKAAENAKEAGFDGVELHGADGYLVDQFLRDGSNHRTDGYGGSAQNRARFALEAIDVLTEIYGSRRVGIKLSPVGRSQDMYDSDPMATYSYLLKELIKRDIAYVHLVESGDKNTSPDQIESVKQMPHVIKMLRPSFPGNIILDNNNQSVESGAEALKNGDADLISFGRHFIANPDYVKRVKKGWQIAEPIEDLLHQGGGKGYIDYEEFTKPVRKLSGIFTKSPTLKL